MDEIKKMYWTVPDMFGTFSAIITISGFESEEDAQTYLFEKHGIGLEEIFNESPTIH
jgi:hypothetical protein|tara:strand:- start:347 stop:517 length:171 start_codon:yes stop_codon:yes gene_type:complete